MPNRHVYLVIKTTIVSFVHKTLINKAYIFMFKIKSIILLLPLIIIRTFISA